MLHNYVFTHLQTINKTLTISLEVVCYKCSYIKKGTDLTS